MDHVYFCTETRLCCCSKALLSHGSWHLGLVGRLGLCTTHSHRDPGWSGSSGLWLHPPGQGALSLFLLGSFTWAVDTFPAESNGQSEAILTQSIYKAGPWVVSLAMTTSHPVPTHGQFCIQWEGE